MSYVIYHKETTIQFCTSARKDTWASKGAATRALNAAEREGKIVDKEKYAIAEIMDFRRNIEKTRRVKNLMSGEWYEESVNTPAYCSPAHESYWSM